MHHPTFHVLNPDPGYSCTAADCSFVGKNWTEMTNHNKVHIGKPNSLTIACNLIESYKIYNLVCVCMCSVRVQCDQCKKTFRDSWFLKQHQHVHSKERLVFHCPRDGCSRSYTTAFNLQSHILSFHEEQRFFNCTHPGCGKSFSMKVTVLSYRLPH